MSRAEERAFEAYPDFKVGDSFSSVKLNKQRKLIRHGFIEGYHQAEKDLELTWEDMHTIAIIEDKLIHELCLDDQTLPQTKEFYQEVLKRFKERKGE